MHADKLKRPKKQKTKKETKSNKLHQSWVCLIMMMNIGSRSKRFVMLQIVSYCMQKERGSDPPNGLTVTLSPPLDL